MDRRKRWFRFKSNFRFIHVSICTLLGLPWGEAWIVAQQMAEKIVTNEFVVMGEISKVVDSYSPHRRAVISTFLVSFANFSTIGMIVGTLKGLSSKHQILYLNTYL